MIKRLCVLTLAFVLASSASAAAAPSPPGSNDFNCRPSSAHPYPVVLVHGTFGNQTTMSAISASLKANGYCVFSLDYGGYGLAPLAGIYGTGSIPTSARQLDSFVDRVLAATGASKVSVVGHSQGGMMPRYFIKYLGGRVDDLVGLVPSNHGTTFNGLFTLAGFFPGATEFLVGGLCPACAQQSRGSSFITNLNAGDETPGSTSYTVVATRYDQVVTPYTSSFLSGANTTNITIQDKCPANLSEHVGIIFNRTAIELTRHALGRAGPADPGYQPGC